MPPAAGGRECEWSFSVCAGAEGRRTGESSLRKGTSGESRRTYEGPGDTLAPPKLAAGSGSASENGSEPVHVSRGGPLTTPAGFSKKGSAMKGIDLIGEAVERRVCLAWPKRVTPVNSWLEHIPFGMFLVDMIRPRVLVELGVHYGDSYCAFCQAVAETGSATRCYGVDHFRGDEHAGLYGSEVLADLRAHHDPLYGSFSRIIESTFDEAVRYFEDGSVDLLHIDGLHTYEAVRRDFDVWRPKMSDAGVVLFHDVNVRERGFEVWKLWSELAADHPHFEFLHSHGLGVLAVGDPPDPIRPLFEAKGRRALAIRGFFFELGQRITLKRQIEAQGEKLSDASSELTQARGEHALALDALRKDNEQLAAARAELRQQVEALRQQLVDARDGQRRLEERHAEAAEQWRRIEIQERETRAAYEELARSEAAKQEELRITQEGLARTREALSVEEQERARLERLTRAWLDAWLETEEEPPRDEGSSGEVTPGYEPDATEDVGGYRRWIATRSVALAERDRAEAEAVLWGVTAPPLFSVLVASRGEAPDLLARSLQSVRSQTYRRWQLLVSVERASAPETRGLLDSLQREDSRVVAIESAETSGLTAGVNASLAASQGEFVCILGSRDELDPDALLHAAARVVRDDRIDVLYTDEDEIDEDGDRSRPIFKPDWSPDLLLSQMYVGALLFVRRLLAERVGGFRSESAGAEAYDFALRVTEEARAIAHLPKIAYHRRSRETPRDGDEISDRTAQATIRNALIRREGTGEVGPGLFPGSFRVKRALPSRSRVTVIVRFRDAAAQLARCVDSLRLRGGYGDWDALLVDDGSWEPETRALIGQLEQDRRFQIAAYSGPPGWSGIQNWAADRAGGDTLLFLSAQAEGRLHGWLGAMLEHAVRPQVGAVGARIVYPEGSVCHAGFVLGLGGVAGHAFRFCPGNRRAYLGFDKVIRNVSAVSGAGLMVRKELFADAGGFDASLGRGYAEIDLCLRLRERGLSVVYTPFAELLIHESSGPPILDDPPNARQLIRRWAPQIASDPFYNPNLSFRHVEFALPTEEGESWESVVSPLVI